ncbi:MAG: dockerin type I domain-containing protein, partial [Phycisphaerae bacterium]
VRDLNGDGDALDFGEAIGVATGLNQPAGIVFIPPPAAACVQGDINNDTQVNINDLAPFVDILVGISIPPDPCPADMNEDGQINAVDIQPFVDLLTSNP